MNSLQIRLAGYWLEAGGVIAYPTEAVWGLGCDPWDELAVMRLLAIKQRPVHKGLILVAASVDQLGPLYHDLPPDQRLTLEKSWPGPDTWLLPDPKDLIPPWVKGEHGSVAIRVSAHPVVASLCREFRGMLVSTSANRAGRLEIRSRLRLRLALGDRLDYIVPGRLGKQDRPSTIRDLVSGRLIR